MAARANQLPCAHTCAKYQFFGGVSAGGGALSEGGVASGAGGGGDSDGAGAVSAGAGLGLAMGADVVSALPPSFFEQPTANTTAEMHRINNLFMGYLLR